MSVITTSGYTVPVGDLPLTHARIAHAGTWYGNGTVTVSGTAAGSVFDKDAPNNSLTYESWKPDVLPATWEVDLGATHEIDYCAVAAHTLAECYLRIQYFDVTTAAWITVVEASIIDNAPIFAIFTPVTARRWRLNIEEDSALSLNFVTQTYSVSNGNTLPTIGVIRFGKALQMERPSYGGMVPARYDRTTRLRGNRSEGGEWLGRTRIRTSYQANYAWNNLTAAWVRDNITGLNKLLLSLETEPVFVAWRPATFPEEVDYIWTAGATPGVVHTGPRDLMSFGFSGEGHGYE